MFHSTESFARAFAGNRGIESLLVVLSAGDDGQKLVAAKALTVVAYSAVETTRSSLFNANGHILLVNLLRSENEFVRVQTAWALGQILSEKDQTFTPAFLKQGIFYDSVETFCRMEVSLPFLMSAHSRFVLQEG